MVTLINLPAYQPSPLLDLSPITQALRERQRQAEVEQARALQERQFAEGQRQFNATNALQTRTADRADLDSEYRRPLLDAQAQQALAHANYFKAAAGLATAKAAAPSQGGVDPTSGIGIRADGTIYQTAGDNGAVGDAPRVESRVAGDASSVPEGTVREHADYGRYGTVTTDVPGIVVDKRGRADPYATRTYQGQRSTDALPDEDRKRFLEGQSTQRLWQTYHGRPARAGYMYDRQGREVPIGPLSASADAQERRDRAIGQVQQDLNESEKTLTSGIWPWAKRIAAPALGELGPAGRAANSVLGLEDEKAAFDKIKMGVLQTVYALSGKQTTNKEMENFLDSFMPRGGESEGMLKDKMMRLRRFLGTLQSKVNKGMVYDDAERDAMSEATNADFNKNQGRLPPDKTASTPSGAAQARPRARNAQGVELEWDGANWVRVK